jgi:putative sigma-54 modulation protein
MRLSIEAHKVEVNDELNNAIRTKVTKLEHYFENIVDAIVYLHDEVEQKAVEIKMIVRNETLFVKEKGDTYLSALDEAVGTMKRQIMKYKEKTLKNI